MTKPDTAKAIVASTTVEKERRVSTVMGHDAVSAAVGMIAVNAAVAAFRFKAITAVQAIFATKHPIRIEE